LDTPEQIQIENETNNSSIGQVWFLLRRQQFGKLRRTAIETSMISIFTFIIGLIAGMAVRHRQIHKQNIGEAMVAEVLDHIPGMHVLMNNVTLPKADGTTQIDHVYISERGIFVIETKHYSGWIFGDHDSKHWTQTIYRFKKPFPNPVRQNYGHIKTLQALFTLPESAFIGVVVFTGTAEFKTHLGPNTILLDQLRGFIEQRREKVLDERQMAYVVGRIEMKRHARSAETDEYHINNVRAKMSRRNSDDLREFIRTKNV
jgi:hypothetical protein